METTNRNLRYTLMAATCSATAFVSHAADRTRPLFAFDNGLTRTPGLEQKAALLKELGYDGMGGRPGQTEATLKALDSHGLKLGTLYVCRPVQAEKASVDPALAKEFEILKGRGTIIWFGLQRTKGASDEIAVELLRDVADKAAASGLPVVIYPHVGFYAESVQQILRLVRKANHPNLGASFNLCHFLKLDDEKNLEAVLREAAPHLKLVQISGADSGDTKSMDWGRLIQPVGKGSFDMGRLFKILDDIDYHGPVCLQCYKTPGDDRANLKQSMDAWKALYTDK